MSEREKRAPWNCNRKLAKLLGNYSFSAPQICWLKEIKEEEEGIPVLLLHNDRQLFSNSLLNLEKEGNDHGVETFIPQVSTPIVPSLFFVAIRDASRVVVVSSIDGGEKQNSPFIVQILLDGHIKTGEAPVVVT